MCFLIKHFFLLYNRQQWRRNGGLHQVWCVGARSHRHLNTFYFIIVGCALHTHQYLICIVAIVVCTHIHHVIFHYKIIGPHHILLRLLTAPMNGQHRGFDNIAQETTADILVEDQLQPPLDMATDDQEPELHKQPNNLTLATAVQFHVTHHWHMASL